MGVSVLWMFHQPRHSPPQRRSTVLRYDVLDCLTELEHRPLGGRFLGEVVAVANHRKPFVAVEVVDSAAGADDEVVLQAEGAQGGADLEVIVGVEAGVHGDYGGGWAASGEHAYYEGRRLDC